jgi:hypothetical protein
VLHAALDYTTVVKLDRKALGVVSERLLSYVSYSSYLKTVMNQNSNPFSTVKQLNNVSCKDCIA